MGGIRRRAVASSLGLATLLSLLLPASTAEASLGSEHIRIGVEVLDFDPLTDGGQPLTVVRGWNDPAALHPQYISDVATASAGIVKQQVVHVTVVRDYPVKSGGFRFTNETYQSCFVDEPPGYCTALIDYGAVLNTAFNAGTKSACDMLRTGRIDEIWLWGGPWFGYLEWQLVTPQSLCPAVRKPFAVMGFSYERGEPEMLHDLGHRAEGLIRAGIGLPLWDRFDGQWDRYAQDFACPAQPDAGHPDVTGAVVHAGNVHFPPNAYCHYQYDRDFAVTSDADDWTNFPNLTGRTTVINFSTWGGTQESFIVWWLGRFPRHRGQSAGVELDWWRYVYFATH
jgi:hypothetical protein